MTITEPEYFQLVRDHRRMLNQEAAGVLNLTLDADAVEYVVSGTVQRVWEALFRVGRDIDNLPGYLRTSVYRAALDHLEHAPKEVPLEDLFGEDGDDPLETLDLHYEPPLSLIHDVQHAMTQLDPLERKVVWGMVVEGLTLEEAAQSMGWRHREQVSRVLRMGLARLRRALSAYDVRRPPHPGA